MKLISEIVGILIISLVMMAIPILCTLSFAYNWYAGLKFILVIVCIAEWVGLMNLILEKNDKND